MLKSLVLLLLAFVLDRSVASNSHLPTHQNVPIIDLSHPDQDQVAQDIAMACSTCGFFQVVSHGISPELINRFREQCQLYFDLSKESKMTWKRNAGNSRGFFDDELTKQKRDWKECLDIGVPGSRNWDLSDDSNLNACLDGWNQFPSDDQLPDFRKVIVEYFQACSNLSDRIARLMAKGMGVPEDDPFIIDLRQQHSSYLRMNYYPPCPDDAKERTGIESSLLGISPHKDAGFLTILVQDDSCHSLQAWYNGQWNSVTPIEGALTINTGDMAQVWSNGKYNAPLHRVMTDPTKKRYSAPFFYNPGYGTMVAPIDGAGKDAKYDPVLWGYFRAVRFAGDLTDLGVEIQIDDYEVSNDVRSPHLDRQREFHSVSRSSSPFDISQYKKLLEKYPDH